MEDQISSETQWSSKIEKLIIDGSKDYALKDFEGASEKFSNACMEYSEENDGNDSPTLLFLYGRAMFQIGVTKSDVLGASNNANGESNKQADKDKSNGEANPNFQLADDVADDEDEEQEEDQEEQSEFELAWEALDAARALFLLEIKEVGEDATKVKSLETKLAETFDLLGEVSLESENFPQAAQDLLESLVLKEKLYKPSSSLISEGHFKLSLAYEFCVEDPKSKDKAIKEMEKAIASVKERIKESETPDATLVKDLQTRLMELKKSKYDEAIEQQKSDALLGLIGQDSDMKQQIAAALGGAANDISSLVKKKKPAVDNTKGKRKVDGTESSTTTETDTSKKQKTAE